LIGLISDTHGLLRPEALAALQGVSQIIHAGDVGAPEVLSALAALAPVHAIRGNVDGGAWAEALPATRLVEVEGQWVYVLHDLGTLDLDPAAAGVAAVISGHSHQPRTARRYGVLYVNPGSAGPRRFKLPVTLARLWMGEDGLEAELVNIVAEGPLRETKDDRG
jgi:putative phosphoesterase